MNVSVLFPPENKCKKGSIAHDATVKSFLSQPHQFTAVLEFYRTEWVRLDAAQQGGGSCLFDVTNQSGEIAKSVFYKMVCVFSSSIFFWNLSTFQEINHKKYVFIP